MVLPVNGEKPFCEDERNVYILEASWNGHNAVFAVNKSTGNITEVVASMKKQPRGLIHQIGTDGKHLYLTGAAGMDKSRFVQIDADGSTHVMDAIQTDIFNPYKQQYTTNHADRIYIDSLGNIWLLSNGSQIIIYNPDNIMGLSTVVNHVKTFKR